MRVKSSLSIKESIRLKATHGGVGEALVSRLTAAHACRLAVEYVIPLTSEPPVMTFTFLSGVGSTGWSTYMRRI